VTIGVARNIIRSVHDQVVVSFAIPDSQLQFLCMSPYEFELFIDYFLGPLFRVGRWCIEKWESLEEDEEGRRH
jgi:hypothetical protein